MRQSQLPAQDRPVPPLAAAARGSAVGCEQTGLLIRVSGLVQGVGFRPTVWRLAQECGLSGDVRNDGSGVLIRTWGPAAAQQRFSQRLAREAPPLARIDALSRHALDERAPRSGFSILASTEGEARTGIVPDAAACAGCLAEVFDRDDRRAGYPFTNCTHCGPRLSIAQRIPWDRCNTSMAEFAMCADCRREYENPANRRFHAQPIACPECGPVLWLEATGSGIFIDRNVDPIRQACQLITAGLIVAIKGIGGIHLACDATNDSAVDRLRRRKRRQAKPFALMATDTNMIGRYCRIDAAAAALLGSTAAPIVLLPAFGTPRLAAGVAPGQNNYGFMLPYSPLHHLLMAGMDAPIVLTSGNRSDEPQCIGNQEARTVLGGIADALLLNDRDIVNRIDDSVVRVIAGRPAILRRSRGYAPASLRLPPGFDGAPAVLAMGGELKNTFCLLRDGEAILSQHLGDLANASANKSYRDTLDLFLELLDHRPRELAIDAHPDYLPSKIGRALGESARLKTVIVQHHHAHIASCLADNGIALGDCAVLGIALDGTGFGDDGTFWGGEFLFADYLGYRRLASFTPVRMPGGARAISEPWRMGWAHLHGLDGREAMASACADQEFFRALADKPVATLEGMLRSGFNSPLTSSCGRLFDAVAAVLGIRQRASYEAQAAIELEAIVDFSALHDGRRYPFEIRTGQSRPTLSATPIWRALLDDMRADVPRGVIAARFHAGLAHAIVAMVDHLTIEHDDAWSGRVALSGGVFQNAVLSELLVDRLEASGRRVLRHARVPANDGGLSLGQAAVAAARAVSQRREERAACA